MSKRTSQHRQGLLSLLEKMQVPDPRLKPVVIRESRRVGGWEAERRSGRGRERKGEWEDRIKGGWKGRREGGWEGGRERRRKKRKQISHELPNAMTRTGLSMSPLIPAEGRPQRLRPAIDSQ